MPAIQLIFDFLLVRDFEHETVHDRIVVRVAREERSASERDIAVGFLFHAGDIGCETDIDRDRHIRIDSECAGCRAAEPELLLNGSDRIDADFDFASRQQLQCFDHDERADLVVKPLGHDTVFSVTLVIDLECDRITDSDQFLCLVRVFRPDINPEILEFGGCFAFFRRLEMNRFPADYAGDLFAPGIDDVDLDSGQGVLVDAADLAERNKSALVDVDDLETDLVIVSGEHDLEFRVGIEHRNGVARDVGSDLVCKFLCIIAERGGGFKLESGGTGGVHERFKEVQT